MDRKLNLKKGDKCIIAIKRNSNASRYVDMSLENIDKWTYEGEIVSVGAKYVGVKFGTYDNMKFVIEDGYINKWSRGGADYEIYQDIQEIRDKRENEEITNKIRTFFGKWGKPNLPLEKSKEVYNIIKEYEEEGNE